MGSKPGEKRGKYYKVLIRSHQYNNIDYSRYEKELIFKAIEITIKKESKAEFTRNALLKKANRIIKAYNKKKGIDQSE